MQGLQGGGGRRMFQEQRGRDAHTDHTLLINRLKRSDSKDL